MSKHEGQQQGPTWNDVHDYCDRLQARWNVHIVFRTRFLETGRPARRTASVVADACETAAVGAPVRAMGYYAFRGNSGAATMPAAMWHALSELEGKLEGVEKVAQARMAF